MDRMFVGIELRNPQQSPTPDQLEPLEFELQRYMKHVHVGPYQALPQKWKELKAELAARGEIDRLTIAGDLRASLRRTFRVGNDDLAWPEGQASMILPTIELERNCP